MALPYAGNAYLYKRGYSMEFMRIVCYATTLVLSGRLEELRKVTESDTIKKTEV